MLIIDLLSQQHLDKAVLEDLACLAGKINWPKDNGTAIATASHNTTLVAVSDRSVKKLTGTYEWILSTEAPMEEN